jgi:hypothetical protein
MTDNPLNSKEYLAMVALNSVVEEMQGNILRFEESKYCIPSEEALNCIQEAMAQAALCAKELTAENFIPGEIRRQRSAIRNELRRKGL